MKDFDLKGLIALIVVVGTLIIFGMLATLTIPDKNRDLLNFMLGVWGTGGFAVIMKRIFDGTDSSDTKNQTIASMANAMKPQDGAQ